MARSAPKTALRVIYLMVLLALVAGTRILLTSDIDWSAPGYRIADQGRLTLDRELLPDQGPIVLVLALDDSLRGPGDRPVLIVASDGRRLETKASPVPGVDSGVRLEIDRTFLLTGLYMIQVESAESHPLNLRRYVLELK
jgi:hypothetical protein